MPSLNAAGAEFQYAAGTPALPRAARHRVAEDENAGLFDAHLQTRQRA
jgi:hypothetical protein